MFRFSILLLVVFIVGKGFALGDTKGNGGDAVVCRNAAGTIQSVQLLDYYEANLNWKKLPDFGSAVTIEEKVEYAIRRLTKVDPERTKLLLGYLSTFFNEAVIQNGILLVDIPDSEHVALPIGCSIEQIAVQIEPLFPEDPRYTINGDLWARLPADHQAGLVLHEIIYRMFESVANNSISSRKMNGLLSTKLIEPLTLDKYIAHLKKTELGDLNFGGFIFLISKPITFHKNGNIATGTLLAQKALIADKAVEFYGGEKSTFYESGKIKSAKLCGGDVFIGSNICHINGDAFFSWYLSGVVETTSFLHHLNCSISINLNGLDAEDIVFYESGEIKEGSVACSYCKFQLAGGGVKYFSSGKRLLLNKAGEVIKELN